MIRFKARGCHSPVLQLIPRPESLLIRADCEDNPEFWVEIEIPREELVKLLAAQYIFTDEEWHRVHVNLMEANKTTGLRLQVED